MCRMIAITGDVEIQRKALQAFHRLGKCGCLLAELEPGHLDGWGISGYRNGEAAYVARSPGSVEEEKAKYLKAVDDVATWKSPVVLGHVRKASRGAVNIENVHPFIEPPWMFCHNGTVDGLDKLGPKPRLSGTSDSEEIFRRWLAQGGHGPDDFAQWLDHVGSNCPNTSLCSLLTDGRQLFASRRIGTTFFRPIDTPQAYAEYYTLFEWRQGNACVVCSEKLPELAGDWRLLADGENLIVRASE